MAFGSLGAQPLLPEAERIKKQYDYYLKDHRASLHHVDYITAFPENKAEFMDVFYPYKKDQLYEARHEYIKVLADIGKQYPHLVLAKGIVIGKELTGSEDIVGDLQEVLIEIAANHVPEFIKEVKKLKKQEQQSFAGFLADAKDRGKVENLRDQLQAMKEDKLAGLITGAIRNKEKQTD